jgi:hypothetical protein
LAMTPKPIGMARNISGLNSIWMTSKPVIFTCSGKYLKREQSMGSTEMIEYVQIFYQECPVTCWDVAGLVT